MTATVYRVLLVEDEAAVRQWLRSALQGLPVQLQECSTVAQALQVLQTTSVDLLITDMVFPGESGLALVQYLYPLWQEGVGPKALVFSGAVHAAMREQLQSMGVWHCLSKPSSPSEVAAWVRQALGIATEAPVPPPPEVLQRWSPQELAAIETYFDGDAAFYDAFRVTCVRQFVHDLAEGDAACQAQDAATLRRTVHSLKSVLRTLGYPDHSMLARNLEELAQHGPWVQTEEGWQQLRQRMVQAFALAA